MFLSENRYLLILTENYAALRIMQQQLLKTSDDAVVIFGSSFPNDQEYTQVNEQYSQKSPAVAFKNTRRKS